MAFSSALACAALAPGASTRCGVEAMVAAIGGVGVEHQRRPQLGGLGEVFTEVGRQAETGRHHADDLVAAAVELDRPADDRRVTAEAPLPQPVAQQDDGGAVAGGVLARAEPASEHRHGPESLEDVRGDLPGADPFGIAVAGEVGLPGAPRGDVAQQPRALAVVAHLGRRHPCLVQPGPAAPHHHAPVRLAVRQRREQHGAEHAEDRAGRAHTQRQGDDGHRGKAGLAAKSAKAETEVLQE